MPMIHIGNRIKELLRQRNVKQIDLAAKIGKTRQGLNAVLRRRDVGSDWVQMIMEHSGISATEIFEPYLAQMSLPQENTAEDPSATYVASGDRSRLSQLEMQLAIAQNDVQRFRELLEEKERLIQVLLQRG